MLAGCLHTTVTTAAGGPLAGGSIEHDEQVREFVKLFDTLPGKVATRDQVLALARELGTIELPLVRAALRLAGGEGRE